MFKKIPTIRVSGDVEQGNVYLTSGIQPPSDDCGTPFEQVQVHSEMQSYASGGSIYHMNLAEQMNSSTKCNLIKSLFNKFPLRYITLTPMMSVCQTCGSKMVGKKTVCSACSSTDMSIWSRVVGYYRPAIRKNISEDMTNSEHKFWASSRLEEFRRRTFFNSESISGLLDQTRDVTG